MCWLYACKWLFHTLRGLDKGGFGTCVCVVFAVSCATLSGTPSLAYADAFDDYEAARVRYDAGEYQATVTLLQQLLEDDELNNDRALRLESLKYLGAAYLFLEQPEEARRQFRVLLQEDSLHELDPTRFPADIQSLFENERRRVQAEMRAAQAAAQAEAERLRLEKEAAAQAEAERTRRLVLLARTETVQQKHDRFVAWMPFGAGQFQNGDAALGRFFMVSELLLTATSITTYLFHRSLWPEALQFRAPGGAQGLNAPRLRRVERALRISNQATTSTLALVAVAGVIQANVQFQPFTKKTRLRELPVEFSVSLGLLSVGFQGNF